MAALKKRILIVEDDQEISLALAIRLKSEGYDVIAAADAIAGTAAAMNNTPDLILMDISMPAGTGLIVADRIRKNHTTADIPIIFLTANRDPQIREEVVKNFSIGQYFEKPFETEKLLATIHDMVSA